MPEINIGRLTLKLSGLSEGEGQRLARLIAEGLATAPGPTGSSRHLDALQADVSAWPGIETDDLSKQIVADLLRQLDRSV